MNLCSYLRLFVVKATYFAHVVVHEYQCRADREVNNSNLLGGQFLIFLPKNFGK